MSQVPMDAEQFFQIFRAYNEAFWPVPLAWTIAALLVIWVVLRSGRTASEAVCLFLAGVWAWAGVAYHILFHAPQNPAAYVFGALFVLQAALFLRVGFIRGQLVFGPRLDAYGVTGAVLMGYALAVYPLLGVSLGHAYPQTPTFGVPCPTTIFTFGMLLWTTGRVPWYLLIIPVVWSFVAVGAAVNWGVFEDVALPIAAVVASTMLVLRNRKQATRPRPQPEGESARAG